MHTEATGAVAWQTSLTTDSDHNDVFRHDLLSGNLQYLLTNVPATTAYIYNKTIIASVTTSSKTCTLPRSFIGVYVWELLPFCVLARNELVLV